MPRSASPPRSRSKPKPLPVPDIQTFPQAVRYLYDRANIERMLYVKYDEQNFKLDRMKKLLNALENPHEQLKFVHVAGTVGKGSTVAMLAAMLQGCGYTVGQYTSPHLVDVRERIAINGHPIGKTEFTDLIRHVAKVAAKARLKPTFFELTTAMAFKSFADQAIDIAVVEVGLGGRLDSTNVITPEATIVTHIDYDHMHILGHGIKQIAREKAGIFKRGVPAIVFEQQEEVLDVFREVADKVGAPLKIINRDIEFSFRFGASAELGPHIRVCLITPESQFMHLPVPLPGEHQAANCALALAAVDVLKGAGFEFKEIALHDGLARTNLPGRMELVWDRPRILLDGAHNPAALSSLMRSVGAYVPYDSMVCIFGCNQDKDIPALMDRLALGSDKVIFTKARTTPRAALPEELQRVFNERSGKMSQVARGLPEALDLATRAVSREDLVVITGSFYLVGDAKRYLADLDRKKPLKLAED